MHLYVIRRPSAWTTLEELKAAGAKSARIGNEEMADRVRWIRSYVVHEPDGRIGTFCIYEARDGESIREHARRVGMPGDEFYPVATTVVVRSDPLETQAAAGIERRPDTGAAFADSNRSQTMSRLSWKAAIFGLAGLFSLIPLCSAKADVPDPIRVAGGTAVLVVHAQGAQVYECKQDAGGQKVWQFREPVATLMADGKTIGRHFAGPTWEMLDGDAVTAKVVGRAPGATSADIPLLKLEVTSHRGAGPLAGVTYVQRINTKGGALEGPCPSPGALTSVPYAADYAFSRAQ